MKLMTKEAIFIEPLAAACQITQEVPVKPKDRVLVIGDGKLGLLCAQILQLTGCDLTVIGHHPAKLGILEKRGIRVATQPTELTEGLDIIIEATGTPEGLILANQYVRPRGCIVLKSTYHGPMTLNMTELVINEITIIGSRCGPFAPAIRLLKEHLVTVQPLIQAQYPLNQALEAFEHATKREP